MQKKKKTTCFAKSRGKVSALVIFQLFRKFSTKNHVIALLTTRISVMLKPPCLALVYMGMA